MGETRVDAVRLQRTVKAFWGSAWGPHSVGECTGSLEAAGCVAAAAHAFGLRTVTRDTATNLAGNP